MKAQKLNVPLANVFDTLQVYLGSVYVNDFNRFGRTFQVRAQAEGDFRAEPEDVAVSRGDEALRSATRSFQKQLEVPLHERSRSLRRTRRSE